MCCRAGERGLLTGVLASNTTCTSLRTQLTINKLVGINTQKILIRSSYKALSEKQKPT